jgi:hypothetical protein
MRRISWVTEDLLASQERLCFMELVIFRVKKVKKVKVFRYKPAVALGVPRG